MQLVCLKEKKKEVQFFWTQETEESHQSRSIDRDGPSDDWMQACCAHPSQEKVRLHSMKNVWQLRVFVLLFILSLLAAFNMGKNINTAYLNAVKVFSRGAFKQKAVNCEEDSQDSHSNVWQALMIRTLTLINKK